MKTATAVIILLFVMSGCDQSHRSNSSDSNTYALATSTAGFDQAYALTYLMFDACGDRSFGEWYREAIIAQVETCPLTLAAKENFYKEAARNSDKALWEVMIFYTTHPFPLTKNIPGSDLHCESLNKPEIKAIREKYSQYHTGKIKLSELGLGSCKEGSEAGSL